jgi:hypothetical protein
MKYRNKAQENSRVIRVPLATYVTLSQMAVELDVSVGSIVDALAKMQSLEKHKPESSPAQIPLPSFHFEPKSISSNGIKHIDLKSIRGV